MKLLTVVGARPQFVKAAVVSRAIQQWNLKAPRRLIEESILHTGQHYDAALSDVFFKEMQIPVPEVNLHIGSGSHAFTTAEMLKGIEGEILRQKPECVLVYGDTNSTLAGALAAAKVHVPVAHVEAGLRSFNRKMPEEVNRVVADHISTVLFPCSEQSKSWLAQEGIIQHVHNVGDVMFDAFLKYAPLAQWPKEVAMPKGPYVLATVHRAENTDDVARLTGIFSAFRQTGVPVLLPLHPRTAGRIREMNISVPDNVKILLPQPYFELMALLKACSFTMTDSGGLQKESYFAGKRCLILRDETEWVELVQCGVNKIVGVDKTKILAALDWAMARVETLPEVYGNGHAGEKIVEVLAQHFGV